MKTSITKATLILCLQMVFAVATYANTESNGLKCKLNSYKCENEKGVTSYNVYSEEAKICDISFIVFSAEKADGNFSSYTVNVNGTELAEKISFNESGWQEAHTVGKAVTLNKGNNTIIFTSNDKDIPNIKGIEVFINKKRIAPFSDTSFAGKNATGEKANLSEKRSAEIQPRIYKPTYRGGGVSMNQTYGYTFSMPIHYNAGERASFYAPTANDPKYGFYASDIDFNLYLFHENPALFSESASSTNKSIFWEIEVPYTGLYYLLVEAKNQGDYNSVALLIRNSLYKTFASNTSFGAYKEAPMGYIYVSNTDSCYNIFTVNGRSSAAYYEADPCLWLKKYDWEKNRETIVAYNDNNDTPSDFNWGKNARIRTKLPDGESYNTLLSSAFPSYGTTDTCDFYHSFWNTPAPQNYFQNLKDEDRIESYTYDNDFNCVSWTCGDINTWLWPRGDNNDIKWFDKLYNNETVSSTFGNYKRADGSLKYTRQGATAENSVIDVWGFIGNGEFIFTHTSIRNYSDGIPHGYDWESKLGTNPRIFHPRYSLESIDFGKVIVHYRIADNQTVTNRSSRSIMAEAIADEELVMENITLTPEEEVLLEEGVNNIPAKKIETFNSLYNKWKAYTAEHGHESNMFKFKNCTEYTELLTYINSIANGETLAYDKFIKGDFFVAVLIKDLSDRPDSGTEEIWNSIMNAPLKDNTIRTPRANVTMFIKAVLEKTEASEITEGIKQSNDDDFNVTVSSSQITVDVDLQEASKYSIQVMNLQNDYTFQLSPEKTAEKGKYTHKCDVEPGLYVVTYKLNGNINSKKIIVQ